MDHQMRALNLAKAATLSSWAETLRVAIDGNELNPKPRTYKKLVEKMRTIAQAMEELAHEWADSVPPSPYRN